MKINIDIELFVIKNNELYLISDDNGFWNAYDNDELEFAIELNNKNTLKL